MQPFSSANQYHQTEYREQGRAAEAFVSIPLPNVPVCGPSLFGSREFIALIGASEVHAEEMLDSIEMELEGYDLLLEDFPEAIYPIQRPQGIANRCNGQLYQGERTYISWTAKEIVIPTMPDSNTEARDLMWTFDAVQRLAEAQVASATTTDKAELRDLIQVSKFVRPGLVWWAFD